jgi:hypothetical protein
MELGTVAGSPKNGSAVGETYLGGVEEGLRGRHLGTNMLIVVAAQEDGPGMGRIRMRQIADASAESLLPFVEESIAPESVVRTDSWRGYAPLGWNQGPTTRLFTGKPRNRNHNVLGLPESTRYALYVFRKYAKRVGVLSKQL